VKNRIFIVTGDPGSGKTGAVNMIAEGLKKAGIPVCGFIAEGFWKGVHRDRYELVDLVSGERIVFCKKEFETGWEKIVLFYINPAAIEFGERILNPANISEDAVIVIDEIGPFELEGKGWRKAVRRIITERTGQTMIWVVRTRLVEKAIEHFRVKPYRIIETQKTDIGVVVDEFKKLR